MQTRHNFVDALRGFSLLGILVVNIEFIVQAADVGFSDFAGTSDRIVRWFIVAFAQTKIYPIFALLFGYGLSVQVERARHAEAELKPRYQRRMIGLVLLGVLHGVLFFPGDILVIYAAIGSLAYRFGHHDTPTLLRIAAWTYGLAAIGWILLGLVELGSSPASPTAPTEVLEALSTGSFPEVAVTHTIYWIFTALILSVVQGPAVFACFLVGIALGRTEILANPVGHQELARRTLRWAPLGIVGAGLGATMTVAGGRWDTLGFAIGFAAAPLMAAAYLGGLSLTIGATKSRLAPILQASGRMSLTIYLLESVAATTLSYGYGFGIFGSTGPARAMLIAIAIWLALSAFAVAWMRYFRYGPFEWALRSFTYGARQPLRSA